MFEKWINKQRLNEWMIEWKKSLIHGSMRRPVHECRYQLQSLSSRTARRRTWQWRELAGVDAEQSLQKSFLKECVWRALTSLEFHRITALGGLPAGCSSFRTYRYGERRWNWQHRNGAFGWGIMYHSTDQTCTLLLKFLTHTHTHTILVRNGSNIL